MEPREGKNETCGIYMCGNYWKYEAAGKAKRWFCEADWKRACEATENLEPFLLETYGSLDRFPIMGCSQKFYPFAKGPSMVFEFRSSKGTWHAVVAERPPTLLQNDLEKVRAKV